MLLYVHRNRRFIRDGSPGRPPRLSHNSWTSTETMGLLGMGAQDGHLDFHTAPGPCCLSRACVQATGVSERPCYFYTMLDQVRWSGKNVSELTEQREHTYKGCYAAATFVFLSFSSLVYLFDSLFLTEGEDSSLSALYGKSLSLNHDLLCCSELIDVRQKKFKAVIFRLSFRSIFPGSIFDFHREFDIVNKA